ncbi:hypothetical protein Back11_54700 [Paenibacillus baekrokdamisoli]|uniref:Uncharacterized protein n=1 Tax=Paenibacillus baekrokdamisoli TaxID=1712516 RepID=A0A3G9J732_9BACL|nr:CD3324 family protein [Paenibacillus baekrokdamisoli]MBB3071892.1 Mor family transcriptional regulator [Paenibacillus baekrokdamisoli]BBH24125.1 hypothetical protein Back11_54700 [Paenibacillus baekrokdamisoli]
MKKYRNAKEILPPELVEEIQKYVDGSHIYIPAKDRKAWGTDSGTRHYLDKRNFEMLSYYHSGTDISTLSKMYGLSEERVRSIVYGQK